MSLIYIVRWRCATSCELVRPSKIILRYPTMLGIAARLLNITETPKTSGDDPWWLRRRVTSHDYTRFTPEYSQSPKFTHRRSSYDVVKAGATVALANAICQSICCVWFILQCCHCWWGDYKIIGLLGIRFLGFNPKSQNPLDPQFTPMQLLHVL